MKKLYFLLVLLGLTGLSPLDGAAGQDTFFSDTASFSIQIDKKDASSAEAKDGSINILISGGQAPYAIHCFSPYSLPSKSAGNELKMKNLGAGVYLFVIQDNSGHTESREIKVDVQ